MKLITHWLLVLLFVLTIHLSSSFASGVRAFDGQLIQETEEQEVPPQEPQEEFEEPLEEFEEPQEEPEEIPGEATEEIPGESTGNEVPAANPPAAQPPAAGQPAAQPPAVVPPAGAATPPAGANAANTPALVRTGSQVTVADAQAALKLHNDWRKAVGSPPLQWSTELAVGAQQWAETLAAENRFDHAPQDALGNLGENLAQGTGMNAAQGTQFWLDEKKEHFDQGRIAEAGHYTQAVWQKTTKVGIGIAKNGDSFVVVARYSPGGNVAGEAIFPNGAVYPSGQ